MANQRVLSLALPFETWCPSNWAPSGEYIFRSYQLPFQLLPEPNVEVRIHLNAWCSGLTPPPDPRVRFRLGGSFQHALGEYIFVNEATHGALLGEFDVGDAYYAGDFYFAPSPTFNMDNAQRYDDTFVVANPNAPQYLRFSAMADATDRGCGLAAARIDIRGVP